MDMNKNKLENLLPRRVEESQEKGIEEEQKTRDREGYRNKQRQGEVEWKDIKGVGQQDLEIIAANYQERNVGNDEH